jgi:predicted nucleic acid-binding protein
LLEARSVIVVDTSAIVDLLLELPVNDELHARLVAAPQLHAPHLVDVEFLSVLRHLSRRGELSVDAAAMALENFDDLPIERYPLVMLGPRIWALRHTLTAYDAAYVALSEMLGLPLVTSDARLSRAGGHGAVIQLFQR